VSALAASAAAALPTCPRKCRRFEPFGVFAGMEVELPSSSRFELSLSTVITDEALTLSLDSNVFGLVPVGSTARRRANTHRTIRADVAMLKQDLLETPGRGHAATNCGTLAQDSPNYLLQLLVTESYATVPPNKWARAGTSPGVSSLFIMVAKSQTGLSECSWAVRN